MTQRHLFRRFFILAGLLALSAPISAKDTISFHAGRFTINGDSSLIEASEGIHVHSDSFQLKSDTLRFDPPLQRLSLSDPFTLQLPTATLRGESGAIHLSENTIIANHVIVTATDVSVLTSVFAEHLLCHNDVCRLQSISAPLCPHSTSVFLHARTLNIDPDGVVRLKSPRLHIGTVPVAALPFLKLVPPSHPGLHPPTVEWNPSGGLIVGPTIHLPISPHHHATVYAAMRSTDGMESEFSVHSPTSHLQIDYLLSEKTHHGHLQITSTPPLQNANAGVDADLVTDRRILDNAFLAERRSVTHTHSRARLSVGDTHANMNTQITHIQAFDADPFSDSEHQFAHIHLSSTLSPLWSRYFFSELHLSMDRHHWLPQTEQRLDNTRFLAQPLIRIPISTGPLAFRFMGATLHQALISAEPQNGTHRHSVGLSADVELPMYRRFSEWTHLISFGLNYRSVPVDLRPKPITLSEDLPDRIHRGDLWAVTLQSAIGRRISSPAWILDLHYLRNFGWMDNAPFQFLQVTSQIHTSSLHAFTNIQWEPGTLSPATLSAEVDIPFDSKTRWKTGIRYYGSESPPIQLLSHTRLPWLYDSSDYTLLDQTFLVQKITTELSSFLTVHGGIHLQMIPRPLISALFYGMETGTRCGCLRMRLLASHVPRHPIPNVLLTFHLNYR